MRGIMTPLGRLTKTAKGACSNRWPRQQLRRTACRLLNMAEPSGDLEPRVTALEARVGELADRVQHNEQDAAAARVLAGGADRDVDQVRGEIRDFRQATTGGFNALRDDLIDLRSEMRSGFTEVRGRMDATAAGLDQIAGLLNTLIGQQGGDQPGDTDR